MANSDIAQALFVTTRTVETHLSAVYRKLGIDSRGGLRNALRQPVNGTGDVQASWRTQ
jgi:DNA-binding NarL/FixJ family response regulator